LLAGSTFNFWRTGTLSRCIIPRGLFAIRRFNCL
jgi:hypothetical protein